MILISIGQGNKARITGSTRGGHGRLLPRHDGQRQYAGQLQKERSFHDSVVVRLVMCFNRGQTESFQTKLQHRGMRICLS